MWRTKERRRKIWKTVEEAEEKNVWRKEEEKHTEELEELYEKDGKRKHVETGRKRMI
jgi:hypothetical protein